MPNKKINTATINIPLAKRLFDILLSGLLIIFTLPIFIIILTAIFIEHIFTGNLTSSLFYTEKRISQGKAFNFVKFNIFNPKVLKKLRQQKIFIHTKYLEKDPDGLAKVGKIIQRTYMDELPQLFAILKGKMSFVCPRPVNLEVYKEKSSQGEFSKTAIKSGLTGIYQALKGSKQRKSDAIHDKEYCGYVRNNPGWKVVLFDIKILLKTLKVVVEAKGI